MQQLAVISSSGERGWGGWRDGERRGRGRTPTAWQELTVLIRSASPPLDSALPCLRSKRGPFDMRMWSWWCTRLQAGTTRDTHTHTHTHTHTVCHVKIEADEIEYLTQSRNPTGSILSQSYYSVYYIYIGTMALKSHTRWATWNWCQRWLRKNGARQIMWKQKTNKEGIRTAG